MIINIPFKEIISLNKFSKYKSKINNKNNIGDIINKIIKELKNILIDNFFINLSLNSLIFCRFLI